jgi:hypothetical protein
MVDNGQQESNPGGAGSSIEQADTGRPAKYGFLELIYGVLFDPVKTFKRAAESPPVGSAVLIFSLVKVLSVFTALFLSTKIAISDLTGLTGMGMEEMFRAAAPAAAVFMLAYYYIKWFVYSGLLYLLAELSGGSGRAAGVLAVTGLASLPALLFLPFQILVAILGYRGFYEIMSFIFMAAIMIWGFVLVVIGLGETQRLSSGRAVMVALAPAAAAIFICIVLLALIIAAVAPMGRIFSEMYM